MWLFPEQENCEFWGEAAWNLTLPAVCDLGNGESLFQRSLGDFGLFSLAKRRQEEEEKEDSCL